MNANPTRLPTSAEIDRRLRIVAELRNLCLSLGHVRSATVGQSGALLQTSGHAGAANAREIGSDPLQMRPELAVTIRCDPTDPDPEDE